VKSDAVLRQTTMVALASIVRLACIDRKSSETRFPTMRHGSQFCTGVSRDAIPRRLVQLLTPYLSANETRAESGDVMAVLSAFNILGHDSIIDVVVPLIEGRSVDNPSLRSKAVLTLHKLAHSGDQQAVRILHTVYANPSENYQVSNS
jgi:Lipoprotein amino terminal region